MDSYGILTYVKKELRCDVHIIHGYEPNLSHPPVIFTQGKKGSRPVLTLDIQLLQELCESLARVRPGTGQAANEE